METHAKYRLVGAFVLILLLGSFGFVMWMAKMQLGTRYAYYDIFFSGAVTGLRVDSRVSYRGITVGRVQEITIDPSNVERVRVTIEVPVGTPIRQDSEATLRVEGLVGATFILLSGGSEASPPLAAQAGQRHPVIASKPSPIEEVIEGAPQLVMRAEHVLRNLSDLLSTENVQAVGISLRHLSMFTTELSAGTGDLRALVPEARALVAELRDASRALTGLAATLGGQAARLTDSTESTAAAVGAAAAETTRAVQEIAQDVPAMVQTVHEAARSVAGALAPLSRDLPPAVASIREAAHDVSRAADSLTALIGENRAPLREFTASGLTELRQLLVETRDAVQRVGRVAKETQSDPLRFLLGDSQRGYAVPR